MGRNKMTIEIIKGHDNQVAEFFSSPARPTPETDAEIGYFDLETAVSADFARRLERERDEAGKELSSIHRWIERNHADGFIDSLTYLQNLERVVDCWYDRIDAIESDARRYLRGRDEAREQAQKLRVQLNHYTQANEMAEQAFRERDEAHKIAEQAIDDLAWFNEINAQILREQLEQIKEETK
jgi:hypothetical protein